MNVTPGAVAVEVEVEVEVMVVEPFSMARILARLLDLQQYTLETFPQMDQFMAKLGFLEFD